MAAILIVDDEPSARSTAALLLEKRGHRVRSAEGVSAAVSALGQEVFDVIVTDLRMPDGAGLDVLQAVKRRTPSTPVILLTAYPAWESAKEAIRLGALDYLEKGQEPEALFERIDAALADRASRGQVARWRAGAVDIGRRQVLTVLFADVRGSLELIAERDLEEARQILDGLLRRMIAAVQEAGGSVSQVMGDGIMALFGAEGTGEAHALGGCLAALDMHARVAAHRAELRRTHGADVSIRVGINSGEVLLRSLDTDPGREVLPIGRTTHVAARMEQLAPPGGTLITADTRGLAGDVIRARPAGRLPVKGLAAGVVAFELLGRA